jgi:hypothetical protein
MPFVSEKTLINWQKKCLKSYKNTGIVFYDISEVESFIKGASNNNASEK